MNDPETIFTQARIAYYQTKQNYNPQLEITISKSAFWAYEYAQKILKSSFLLAEPLIITSGFAIDYAKHIIKGRFKLLEQNIKNKSVFSQYIERVMEFNHE